MKLDSYVNGQWIAPNGDFTEVRSAVTGDVVAEAMSGGLICAASSLTRVTPAAGICGG
jgi:hypothetical protein